MSTSAQPGAASTYTWTSADGRRRVYLSLDLVERLSVEVMRAYASVPRRGAEVGGFLIGRVLAGPEPGIAVDDYFAVPCQHQFGPSYVLADDELLLFQERVAGFRSPGQMPVGYYRSHTREGIELGTEDQSLLARCFPAPPELALLLKPTSTRLSVGAFCFAFEPGLPPAPPHFPFRRKELEAAALRPAPVPERVPGPELIPVDASSPAPQPRRTAPAGLWIALSVLGLIAGLALGFFLAQTLTSSRTVLEQERFYSIGLSVTRSGDNLNVRWDRQSKPVRAAVKGTLTIQDGSRRSELEMDAVQLQGGALIYRPSGKQVRFTMELQLQAGTRLSEVADWP
jgi:hypothetical protein